MKVTFEKILETSKRLKGSIINTPFVKANKLSSRFKSDIFLIIFHLKKIGTPTRD